MAGTTTKGRKAPTREQIEARRLRREAAKAKAENGTAHKTSGGEAIARRFVDRLGEMRLFNCEPGDWETLGDGQRAYLIDAIEGDATVGR